MTFRDTRGGEVVSVPAISRIVLGLVAARVGDRAG